MFDTLEPRRLMSVSLNPATGILTATGTPNDDRITMSVSGGTFRVQHTTFGQDDTSQTRSFAFPAASVKGVVARGGDGADEIALSPTVTVNAKLYANGVTPRNLNSGGAVGDSLTGGSGNDLLVAGGANLHESLDGGAGNDVIDFARSSEDYATGGPGNDRFINVGFDANLDGGTGTDTADFSHWTVGLKLGPAEVWEDLGVFLEEQDPIMYKVENITGGRGDDLIYGNAGRNILKGGGGNDRVYGLAGDDVLFGGAGNDRIDAGSGRDALHGDDGNDTLFSRDSVADFLSGGFGTDKARKDSADQLVGVEGLLA